jgi:hypothetical protein
MRDTQTAVLIVDDDLGEQRPTQQALRDRGVSCSLLPPEDLTIDDIQRNHLVLIDYDLRLPAAEHLYSSVPDGVALAAVLRRHTAGPDRDSRPTAFALLTGKLERLSHPLPPTDRRPQLARHNNLEWVFAKDDPQLLNQIESLASAVALIPPQWADGIDGIAELAGPLVIDPAALDAETCMERIDRCCPPFSEFTQWTHGLAFVRWFLHFVLPYPCFLSDLRRVALRWRVEYAAFSQAYSSNEALRQFFASAAYEGLLKDFDRARWWTHRLEQLAWDKTNGDSLNAEILGDAMKQTTGLDLPIVNCPNPVICHDENLRPIDDVQDSNICVRVRPDGWPPYAEAAWVRIETVLAAPKLRSIVYSEDMHLLPELHP